MKKFIYKIFILFCTLTLFIFTTLSFADDLEDETTNSYTFENIQDVSSKISSNLNINSRAYVVIDRNSNTVIVGKNEYQKKKMASTTKIMTAIVVIENVDLKDIVNISKKAAGTGGSRLGLKTDDKISVHDLLYGLLLCSGNDAAVALAEYTAGSIYDFSILMNEKAQSLNLKNTHFVTPHGLDSDDHYTTAYELAILSNYALQNSTFSQIVGTKNYTITINGYSKSLSNTNELLGNLNGVYGIKTGFTNGANRCLVTACKRNDLDIICVVLGADTKKFRTQDSIKLIEYTFSNFELVDIQTIMEKSFKNWKNENENSFFINKGTYNNIELSISTIDTPILPIQKNSISDLKTVISCNKNLQAPIYSNTNIGSIKVYCNEQQILSCSIVVTRTIEKKNSFDYFYYILKNYPEILKNVFL